MIFTEPRFLVFFFIVLGAFWALRSNTSRKVWLLLVSYVFYAAWDWRYLSLIIASTVIDYVVANRIVASGSAVGRKRWVTLSVIANLGILGVFKYFNFFADSLETLLGSFGMDVALLHLDVVLPVGISFYTFQTMSYTLDVYRGSLQPVKRFLDLALFVGFFPQLVAGPIVRASTFLPQLLERTHWRNVQVRSCLMLFMLGFIKKACISDNLSFVVDPVFQDPANWTPFSIWIGMLFFAVQLYCDFSGYTDMATACARLLGYELCPNFEFPYFAKNINDFWRRWHISLSSWFRDYLYIPLGGSQGSRLFTTRNLLITTVLTGLWHGASWNFVFFGLWHGGLIIGYQQWRRIPKERLVRRIFAPLGIPITFWCVVFPMSFFRANTFADALLITRKFVLFSGGGTEAVDPRWLLYFTALAVVHWLAMKNVLGDRITRVPDWAFSMGYGAAIAIVWTFVPTSHEPFIYFQF